MNQPADPELNIASAKYLFTEEGSEMFTKIIKNPMFRKIILDKLERGEDLSEQELTEKLMTLMHAGQIDI